MKIKFYGASDDLVEFEVQHSNGKIEQDEVDCCNGIDSGVNGCSFNIGGKLQVVAIYLLEGLAAKGTWILGAAPIDEEIQIPDDWKISIKHSADSAYSAEITVEIPDSYGTIIPVAEKQDEYGY